MAVLINKSGVRKGYQHLIDVAARKRFIGPDELQNPFDLVCN